MTKPTIERITELLDVDTTTGLIVWRKSQGRAKAGAIAGRIHLHGYREITVDGQPLMAHAIVWLVATGDWPPLIDHRDGKRAHNAFDNLRCVDSATNARNRTNWVHTKLLGAFETPNGRFSARITADSREFVLGTFESEELAHERYRQARDACDVAELAARTRVLEEMQASARCAA